MPTAPIRMARFAYRHRKRLSLVSKFVPDANLFEPRRSERTRSWPPSSQREGLAQAERRLWQRRKVNACVCDGMAAVGDKSKSSRHGPLVQKRPGIVPVLWVFVRDLSGTHRDEYFFTTDTSMSAEAVIEMYGGRWNIETTFQEMRSHLGLESTRGWSRETVLRMAPCENRTSEPIPRRWFSIDFTECAN